MLVQLLLDGCREERGNNGIRPPSRCFDNPLSPLDKTVITDENNKTYENNKTCNRRIDRWPVCHVISFHLLCWVDEKSVGAE